MALRRKEQGGIPESEVTDQEMRSDPFEDFCLTASQACDTCLDEEVNALMMVDSDSVDSVKVLPILVADDPADPEMLLATEVMFSGQRRFAAMATRAAWSPNHEEPTALAWNLVCASTEATPRYFVRRIIEDQGWYEIAAQFAPWFAMSTADSLRAKLNGGGTLVLHADKEVPHE